MQQRIIIWLNYIIMAIPLHRLTKFLDQNFWSLRRSPAPKLRVGEAVYYFGRSKYGSPEKLEISDTIR